MVGLGLAIIAAITVVYADEILLLIGRDATLSGRTGIWERAIEIGFDRPWFGHGYRSFWIWSVSYSGVGHGHNSFLDMWLELGFVGAGIFLIVLSIYIRRTLWDLKNSTDRQGLWSTIFLLYFCIFSLTSKVFPDHGTITWVLFITTLLHLTPRPRPRITAARPVPLQC